MAAEPVAALVAALTADSVADPAVALVGDLEVADPAVADLAVADLAVADLALADPAVADLAVAHPAADRSIRTARPPSAVAAAPRRAVLVVEDSRSTRDMVAAFIIDIDIGEIEVVAVASLREAQEAIAARRPPGGWLCAVLDLNLPDAPHGEVVDMVRAHGVPIIVLAAAYSEPARRTLVKQGVVDYVVKRHPSDLRHVAELVRRVRDNPAFQVLVVDASAVVRDQTAALLQRLSYRTVCAGNGAEALAQWAAEPEICLVITDVVMPVMDGFELIAAIRQRATRQELPIIGVSDRSRADLSTRLLKAGANDFLAKPFEVEEFACRVTQNIDLMAYIRRLKNASRRDALTDLWNRRHLFETGAALHRRALRDADPFAVALIDIDHLRHINDAHGQPAGDQALRRVAACIAGAMRPTDLVARHDDDSVGSGGCDFACVLPGAGPTDALLAIERLRAQVTGLDVRAGGNLRLPLTVSCGVATGTGASSFEAMMATADAALRAAKRTGRNRIQLAG